MALAVQNLSRVFVLKNGGKNITLDDPNPSLTPEQVMDLYSATYPELTTANVLGPDVTADTAKYKFEAFIGKKG